MSGPGVIFKRCGCRDANRRRLEQSCPRLGERGHGTWYFHCSATNLRAPEGTRTPNLLIRSERNQMLLRSVSASLNVSFRGR
jgi:hypothetical protein